MVFAELLATGELLNLLFIICSKSTEACYMLRLGVLVLKEASALVIVVLYVPKIPVILGHFVRDILVLFWCKHALLRVELLQFRVFLQLVSVSSFGAHFVDHFDTTFHVSAAKIVHLQSKLHH